MLTNPETVKYMIALGLSVVVSRICKFFAKKIDDNTFEIAGDSLKEHILGKFFGFKKWNSAVFIILWFVSVVGTKIFPDFRIHIYWMFLTVFSIYLFYCHIHIKKLSNDFKLSTNLINRIILARHVEQMCLILPLLGLYSLWFLLNPK
jgi:hypothetical protein